MRNMPDCVSAHKPSLSVIFSKEDCPQLIKVCVVDFLQGVLDDPDQCGEHRVLPLPIVSGQSQGLMFAYQSLRE